MIKVKITVGSEGQSLISRFESAAKNYKENVSKASEKVADQTVEAVKKLIESQNFSECKISPEWAARKRRLGLDPRVLIATKDYLKSIKKKPVGGGIWGVVCDLQKKKWLEEGARGAPKKVHWEPVLLAMKMTAPAAMAQEVLKDIFGKVSS